MEESVGGAQFPRLNRNASQEEKNTNLDSNNKVSDTTYHLSDHIIAHISTHVTVRKAKAIQRLLLLVWSGKEDDANSTHDALAPKEREYGKLVTTLAAVLAITVSQIDSMTILSAATKILEARVSELSQ